MAAGTDCHRRRQQSEKRHRQPREQRLRRQWEQRLRRQRQLLHRWGRVRREWPERQRTQPRESSGTTLAQTPSARHRHGPVELELPEEDGPEEEELPEEEEVPEDQVDQEALEVHRHRQGCHIGHLQQDVYQDEKKVASTRDCWRNQHRSLERFGSGDAGR